MAKRRIRLAGTGAVVDGLNWESSALLRIGRLENLEASINDPSISRRHAEVEWTEGGWVVRDLGSTNGTFLNTMRVGRADQKLKQGDVLQCGNIVLQVATLDDVALRANEPATDSLPVKCEQAVESYVGNLAIPLEIRGSLLALLNSGREFGNVTTMEALLKSILNDAVNALQAQGGAILTLEEGAEQLLLRAVLPAAREREAGNWVSSNLAERTLSRGEALVCQDTKNTDVLKGVTGSVASILCVKLRTPKRKLGVLQLDRGRHQPPFTQDDLRLANALAANVSAVIESVGNLLGRERDLLVRTLTALAQAVDLRDDYTGSHTQRVTDYSLMLAGELGLSRGDRYNLQIGTPLHDIGKIGISDHVLRKPGPLTEEETEYLKSHTLKGAAIVGIIPHLDAVVPIVRNHHERWDGHGYPDGLAGPQTPQVARIVCVADAFDAMTTDRPYRRGLSLEEALTRIRDSSGTQFDPDCADAFLSLRARLEDHIQQAGLVGDTITRSDLARRVAEAQALHSSRRRTVSIPKSAVIAKLRQKLAK